VPYVEAALLFLLRLWRLALVFVLGWILLLVWLSARRAGRRALEIAIPMWALAGLLFIVAVFAPRPALHEAIAAGLVVLSALLVIASVAVLFLAGRRPPPVPKRRGPPWEGRGW